MRVLPAVRPARRFQDGLGAGVVAHKKPGDMIVKEYAVAINGLYATIRSMASTSGRSLPALATFTARRRSTKSFRTSDGNLTGRRSWQDKTKPRHWGKPGLPLA